MLRPDFSRLPDDLSEHTVFDVARNPISKERRGPASMRSNCRRVSVQNGNVRDEEVVARLELEVVY